MQLENLVRFPNHPNPFLVVDSYCNNPDCRCNKVILTFTEVSDTHRSLKNPLSFSARVDLDSWQETDPPQRLPDVAVGVQEFLDQCSTTRRAEFKAAYEETKRIAERRAQYRLDATEVLEGALVSYADILAEKGALSAGGNAYTFEVRYQGRKFLVEDRYCPNPDCDCQTAHLDFFEAVSGQDGVLRVYQRFLGKVTFAGQLTVEERGKCRPAEAKAILSAWWQTCRDDLEMLKDRYHEVKEIGQRCLLADPFGQFATRQTITSPFREEVPLDDPLAASGKVGRNAPCPCGSGRKFKKCCGRKTTPSI